MKAAPGNFIKVIIFSLLPVFILFAVSELGLRLFNFQYSNTPMEMRAAVLNREGAARLFTETENAGVVRYIKDPKQLWVPAKPFAAGIPLAKRPGVTRIAALGCSCTAGCVATEKDNVERLANGWTSLLSYPEMLGQILEKARPGKYEVLNAGVGGHSSYQGLQRFKNTVLPYKPDILFIYYGWNDHWIAPQEDKNAKVYSPAVANLVNFMEQFRIYQFLHFVLDKINHKTFESRITVKPVFRVSIQDYKSNLEQMVKIAKENNIKVFMMTAPVNYHLIHTDPSIFPLDLLSLAKMHSAYNMTVRGVAAENQVPLIDLATIVNETEKTGQEVISKDGVHLRSDGCRWLAENLSEMILKQT